MAYIRPKPKPPHSSFVLLREFIEHSRTEDRFLNPKSPKTAEYIEGRSG